LHTHEQIVGIGDIAANPKQLHEIMELAVNITAYLEDGVRMVKYSEVSRKATYRDWRRDSHNIALLDEELPGLVAEFPDLRFGYRPAGPKLSDRPGTELVLIPRCRRCRSWRILIKVAHFLS